MWKARNILCQNVAGKATSDKYLNDSVTHDILDTDDIVKPKTHRQANKTCCYIKEAVLLRDNQATHQLNA